MPAILIGIILLAVTTLLGLSTAEERNMKTPRAERGPANFVPLIIATLLNGCLLFLGLFLCADELSYETHSRSLFGASGKTDPMRFSLLLLAALITVAVPLTSFFLRMRAQYKTLSASGVMRRYVYFMASMAIGAALLSAISLKMVEDKPGFLMGIGSLISLIICGIVFAWAAITWVWLLRQE